jgi:ZF-HD homeobox protein with Cys/His-rich dimerization domain
MRRTNEVLVVAVNSNSSSAIMFVAYRERMKNQAINIRRHSLDECEEFMPRGNEGNHVYICQACGCHRCFHMREIHIEVVFECHDHMVLQDEHHEVSPPHPPTTRVAAPSGSASICS